MYICAYISIYYQILSYTILSEIKLAAQGGQFHRLIGRVWGGGAGGKAPPLCQERTYYLRLSNMLSYYPTLSCVQEYDSWTPPQTPRSPIHNWPRGLHAYFMYTDITKKKITEARHRQGWKPPGLKSKLCVCHPNFAWPQQTHIGKGQRSHSSIREP